MFEFVKYERWDDEWCFKPADFLNLRYFSRVDFEHDDAIEVVVESLKERNGPSNIQVDTLNFIIENQETILDSIFKFYQRFLFPVYYNVIDIEDYEIANDPSELSRVIGIKCIEIPQLKDTGKFYFLIQSNFCYDDHGLYLIFENDSVIEFFGEGDRSLDTIEIYQDGLKNKNDDPLELALYKVPRQRILIKNCYFEEEIDFSLSEGSYTASIKCNGHHSRFHFYVENKLDKFSLNRALLMK